MFWSLKYPFLLLFLCSWIRPTFQEPIPVGTQGGQISLSTTTPVSNPSTTGSMDNLDTIRNNMIGGATAIRDSIIGLIAFLVGGAQRAVQHRVDEVVGSVERVVNKTELVKENLQNAGGAIVSVFGNSIRQTGNITGQLVNSLANNQNLQTK